MVKRILDEDLVRFRGEKRDDFLLETKQDKVIGLFFWGDEVDLVDPTQNDDPNQERVDITIFDFRTGQQKPAYIKKKKKSGARQPLRFRDGPGGPGRLLEVTFVDVQQGDATFIRTPSDQKILVDGGEEVFVARLLAAAFPGTTQANPFVLDALVVTHGDADHFSGLINVAKSRTHPVAHKRFFASIRNYLHNGLVKAARRPKPGGGTKAPPTRESFGTGFTDIGSETFITDLFDDPRDSNDKSDTFLQWDDALDTMMAPNGSVRRLKFGDHDAFDGFRPDIDIQVLGPIEDQIDDGAGGTIPALPFLRNERHSKSASHTINGHSIVLKLRYGNVHFLLGGDLNTDAQERLLEHLAGHGTPGALRSEVLKVPHHGSHEFDPAFLAAAEPAISVVSSGDESVLKEYVHPRANLMAALGRHSRGDKPLVFSTELAAFFAHRGRIEPELHRSDGDGGLEDIPKKDRRGGFQAFQRLVFGAVRVRTDGHRVLVAVESASSAIKEAYAFEVDALGNLTELDRPVLI